MSSAGRLTGGGELTRSSARRRPGTIATFLAPLAVLALLLWFLSSCHRSTATLDQLMLSGPRGPACVELDVLPDMSGSMQDFSSARDAAYQQLVRWSAVSLRPDDEIVVIPWASTAAVAAGPTRVDNLVLGPLPEASLDLQGTDLPSAVQAVTSLPTTVCTRSLVFLSDTVVGPVPDLSSSLVSHTVTSITVVLPEGAELTPEWSAALPSSRVVVASGSDAAQTARSLGQAVAFATGQDLVDR